MRHAFLFLVANYNWAVNSAQHFPALAHWKHSSQLVDISIYFLVKDKHTGMALPYVELAMAWAQIESFFLTELDACLQYILIVWTRLAPED